jgi:hypothetical protein
MKTWIVTSTGIKKIQGMYWIIPCISIWYDRYRFLETGLTSPCFGIQISFISFAYGLTIQKGY